MTHFDFVVGPLGSGKTTFINSYLPTLVESSEDIAVAVSDLGSINDDAARINAKTKFGFKAGCICCERKEDLEKLVRDIGTQYKRFIIEPSGAANPIDFISVVEGASYSFNIPLHIDQVYVTLPIKHWEQVKELTSVKAGLGCASYIILTKPLSEEINRKVLDEIRSIRSSIPITIFDGDGRVNLQERKNRVSFYPYIKGHDTFTRRSFSLPQIKNEDELRDILKLVDSSIPRVKGSTDKFDFDIVFGDITVSPHGRDNVVYNRGTLLCDGSHEVQANSFLEHLSRIQQSDILPTSQSSTIDDKLRAFKYYFNFSHSVQPVVEGRVLSNFEGVDQPYTIAKEIYLATGDSTPLQLALVPYVGTRIKALEVLPNTNQDDKAYIGTMLGSYTMQMLSDKDGIDWSSLVDSEQLKKITHFVAPQYIEWLGKFSLDDARFLMQNDKHFPFFLAMAQVARPLVDTCSFDYAAQNMSVVYETVSPQIAKRWKE